MTSDTEPSTPLNDAVFDVGTEGDPYPRMPQRVKGYIRLVAELEFRGLPEAVAHEAAGLALHGPTTTRNGIEIRRVA